MKARSLELDNVKPKEEKKKEVKQEPLLPTHDFKKTAVPTPFDKIPQMINERIMSPLLDLGDIPLMQTSQNLYSFYQKTAYLKKLLHHVAYGEYKNAKILVEQYPQLLLQKGTIEIQHSGLTFKDKTALQIALYLKDTEMVALFQKNMDLEDIEKQQDAQLPKGEDYEAKDKEKIKEGCKILEETFKAIFDAEVSEDDKENIIPDEKAKSAINRLKDYLKPKSAAETETGQDIGDKLLLKAFQLYDAYFQRFSVPADNLTHNSPKNMLVWRQVVGGIQCYRLSFVDIQTMSDWVSINNEKKERGELQGRTLTFEIWDGQKMVPSDFLSLVSNSAARLGIDYAIYGKIALGISMLDGCEDFFDFFKTYVTQKTAILQDLCNARRDQRSIKQK